MCTTLKQSGNLDHVFTKGLFDEYKGLEHDDSVGVYQRSNCLMKNTFQIDWSFDAIFANLIK